jgi:hypothetical protein
VKGSALQEIVGTQFSGTSHAVVTHENPLVESEDLLMLTTIDPDWVGITHIDMKIFD